MRVRDLIASLTAYWKDGCRCTETKDIICWTHSFLDPSANREFCSHITRQYCWISFPFLNSKAWAINTQTGKCFRLIKDNTSCHSRKITKGRDLSTWHYHSLLESIMCHKPTVPSLVEKWLMERSRHQTQDPFSREPFKTWGKCNIFQCNLKLTK